MHKKALRDKPFAMYIKGFIDGSTEPEGWGYQKAEIKRSNLSIVGLVENDQMPTLRAVWLYTKGGSNLIIRNLRFISGRDHELKEVEAGCHNADTDYCDWNAEPDALTVQETQRVWIDHCEFTDGPDYNGVNPHKDHYKSYDGLLDIKRGANYVTVSYSKFSNHDKSILVGHSDSQSTDDFHVTFYRNYFNHLGQRAPRVRYGKVHLLNNLYENTKKTSLEQKYYLAYAIGLAYKADIYSEKNVFDVVGAKPEDLIGVAEFAQWAQHFTDVGSWLNGSAVDLTEVAKQAITAQETKKKAGLPYIGGASWKPAEAYSYKTLNNPKEIRAVVKGNAGVGVIAPVIHF
jgi:pectate lyase